MSTSLAYLVSRYPAVSHTFILREVLELRRAGFHIDVASINEADRPPDRLTSEECAEASAAFYVKAAGVGGAVRAHWAVALERPAAYISGLWFALRLGGSDLRKIALYSCYFAEAVMVGHWMKGRKLNHLHVHFATEVATVGLMAAKTFPVSFSITVHGSDEFYDVAGYHLAEKLSAASLVCAVGFFARSQLMKSCDRSLWGKIRVMPLGVDPSVFTPRTLDPDATLFEVVCVGRLIPAKGQSVLLAAVSQLLSRGRRLRLRLVGDGSDRESLERSVQRLGIPEHVIFEGAVNQDQIRGMLEKADVFALASFAESIPVVLMEAMAMQIPCVSTWVGGIPELIRDSVEGLLVEPGNEGALGAAIGRLMDDGELRLRLGAAGRRRVMEKYDLRTNVGRLGKVFEEQFGDPPLEAAA
jgi:glycosyltransferase involved in cell wall biosynthesis